MGASPTEDWVGSIVEKDERSVVSSNVFSILVYESLRFPADSGGRAC